MYEYTYHALDEYANNLFIPIGYLKTVSVVTIHGETMMGDDSWLRFHLCSFTGRCCSTGPLKNLDEGFTGFALSLGIGKWHIVRRFISFLMLVCSSAAMLPLIFSFWQGTHASTCQLTERTFNLASSQ